MKTSFICILLALSALSLIARTPAESVKSLVASEGAFAAMAQQKGINDAFLAYLAEGSILFHPAPSDARARYNVPEKDTGLLYWVPEIAGVSASGDLGWTSGPFEYRKEKTQEKPIATGHYVTLWKKQSDGSWKVVLDAGISHPLDGGVKPVQVRIWEIPFKDKAPTVAGLAREKAALLKREKQLSPSGPKGVKELLNLMGKDGRVYRKGKAPIIGREAAAKVLGGDDAGFQFEPAFATLAASGDLAYTYGIGTSKSAEGMEPAGEKFSYLHIWERQKDGAWGIILDLTTPIPPNLK